MRRSFTVVSIVAHSVVIASALLAQVVADGALPTPHRPTTFDSSQFMPVDIQLPRPPVVPASRRSEAASDHFAPVVPPDGVSAETGRERETTERTVGLVLGAESGPPAGIGDIGSGTIAPPPPPAPIVPIHLHSGMKAPVKIADVAPAYPVIARNAHIQGVVILEAVLNAQGSVESVRVLRSIPLLDQAAVEAVQRWRFTPALLNGQAVPVVMTVTVNFTLQ
ncbi:MAG: energy transducer TonB [Vicinamibacterales bacterium]